MPRVKNENVKRRVRDYLVNLRTKADLSQEQVAKLSGMDTCTYNQIENGKLGSLMNARKLIALSNALDVKLETMVRKEANYLDMIDELNNKQERR